MSINLFELLGETLKPESLTVKARIVVMSHLSDSQEEIYRGMNAEAITRINFVKYLTFKLGGDLSQEIDPDKYWVDFQKSRVNEYKKVLIDS